MPIRKKKNKEKPRLPTVDEFLEFIPKRAEFEWTTDTDGLVRIKVPKFQSNFGKSFCKIIKKDDIFTANMDKMGSFIWQHCDGENNVKAILEIMKKEYPDEKNIDQRLFLFLRQMDALKYITLLVRTNI